MTERLTDEEVVMLARAFHRPASAMAVLERAGLERSRQPSWTAQTALEFWDEVNNQLHLGVLADGRVSILTAAAQLYPANQIFTAVAGGRSARTSAVPGSSVDSVPSTAGSAGVGSGIRASAGSVPAGNTPTGSVLLAVDAVRFGAAGVRLPVAWSDGLRHLLGQAARGCGLPVDAVSIQKRAGGVLCVVRDDVPTELVVADLLRELRLVLHAHNQARAESNRVRLRVALHQGPVVADQGAGVRGDAVHAASRLVDTPALSRLLDEFPTTQMVVIVSAALFATTVDRRLRHLDPGSFRRVDTDVPGLAGPAFVQLTSAGAAPAAAEMPAADQRSDPPRVAPFIAEEPRTADGWDFLVSAAEEDSGWGEWSAWELEQQGYQVHLDAWDIAAGDHQVGRLNEAVSRSRRTLVILSENYLASEKVQAEWQTAWGADPTGMKRRLIPVRVEVCRPEGLLQGITYIDLVGLDSETARRTFLEEISRAVEGKYRPSRAPDFPGAAPRR